ncbi:MAG TPA: helix-turn-helix domain-containing protein [Acidimicrobiales bacterium]
MLPAWIAEHITHGPDDPKAALLRAAAELMAERSPSDVTLREIAARAGVNYGLIHRHYRTKDRLLLEIFQEFTDYGAEQIRSSETIHEAICRTFTLDSGGFARILTWVALDGVPAEKTFQDTSGMAVFQDLIVEEWERGGGPQRRERFDPRIVSSFVMLMISIWDFYAPYMQQVDDWRDRDLDDVHAEVLELMQTLVSAAAPLKRAKKPRTTRTAAAKKAATTRSKASRTPRSSQQPAGN